MNMFRTPLRHLRAALANRFARNLGAMGMAQLATRLSRLVATVILARALAPADYGMAAIVLTVYELVALFTRNGISAKVVQASAADVAQVAQTAHTMTWLMCGTLMLAQMAIAVPVAALYGNPALALPIALMGLIYLATPLSNIQAAFMQREGRLGRIAFAGGLQVTVDNILTAIFALMGMGMWAILLPKLLVAPIWVVINRTGHAWRPQGGWSLDGWQDIARFSRHVLGIEVMTTIQANVDNLIVGYVLGVEALGIYYFAFNAGLGITLGLVNAFGVAVFPHLSEVRNDRAQLTARYRESLKKLGGIVVPLVLLQTVLAPIYVPLVFGAKWTNAVPVLMIICLSALVRPFATTCEQLLKAVGRPEIALRWQTILTGVLVSGLALGTLGGILGVALAVLIVQSTVLTLYCLIAPRQVLAANAPNDAATFEVVTTQARLLELQPEWDALWARADAPYLSQGFAWCLAGWQTTGAARGRRLHVIVRREGGRAVLIWPMTLRRRGPWCMAKALGAESSEYAPVLVEAGANAAANIQATWNFLRQTSNVDMVRLRHVRQGTVLDDVMSGDRSYRTTEALPAPLLTWIPGASWEAFWRGLKPSFRRGLERRQRRLEEAGTVVCGMAETLDEIQAGIDWALGCKLGWMARKAVGNDYLHTAEYREFLLRLAAPAGQVGRLAVFTLRHNGRMIAAKIGAIDNSRFEGFITANDPAFAAFSPGQIVLTACLKWCHARGLNYDFRIGEEAYKRDWANATAVATTYEVATSVAGVLLLILDNFRRRVRVQFDRLRCWMPAELRRRIKELVRLREYIRFSTNIAPDDARHAV